MDEDAALPPRLPLPRFVLFSWIRMEEDAHRKQGPLSVLRCDDAAARSARCAKVSFYFRNIKQLNKSRTPALKTFPGHFTLSFLRSLAHSLARSLARLFAFVGSGSGGDLHVIKGINIHCRVFLFYFYCDYFIDAQTVYWSFCRHTCSCDWAAAALKVPC